MCGIAGWVDYNRDLSRQHKIAEAMSGALSKRGPDANGCYLDQSAALVQRRLIVIDPEGGSQPMSAEHGGEKYTITYNGMLYNAGEIRDRLQRAGWEFSTRSDTEVVLKAYISWGELCLNAFNGIFALAVWHEQEKVLFAARDRIGVKPFFYYSYGGGLIFGSEIKALLKNPVIKPEVDDYSLKQLLLLGPGRIMGSGCLKGINELKPGQYLTFSKSGLTTKTYWRLTAQPHIENEADTVQRTKELVTDAVKRQLVSDVPLACFLSGGLDSSIICQITAEEFKKKGKILDTYSVDYEDNDKYFVSNKFQPDADGKYIRLMSEFIGSCHNNIVLDNMDVARAVTRAAYARDLPGMGDIDSSLLLFTEKVKERHTVCLSGECADELFGGYPWYHNEDILYRETFPWSNSIELRTKLFKSEVLKGDSEEFVRNEYQKTIDETDFLDTDDRKDRRMREMYMLNFNWFMQTLLDRNDRMSSYSGIESRVPFCDYRLAEYSFNMPWSIKALNGREKGVMREAFKDLLPQEIIHRKKSPYPKTFNPMFLNYVKAEAKRLVDGGGILSEIVDRSFFQDLLQEKVSLTEPWYGQLMRLPQIFAYLIQLNEFFKNTGASLVI